MQADSPNFIVSGVATPRSIGRRTCAAAWGVRAVAVLIAAGGVIHASASAASLTPLGVGTRAFGVSPDGSVVVGLREVGYDREAFRWTRGGGLLALGDLPGGYFASAAGKVSPDGSVVIGTGSPAHGQQAFRWTSAGGMVGLGSPDVNSSAAGVSDDGSVIVGGFSYQQSLQTFYWTSDAGMRRLWDVSLAQGLDPAAYGWSSLVEANGVSGDGSVVVGTGESASGTQAFRWTSRGIVGLGDLPGDSFRSYATAVTRDGSVIVGQSNSASGQQAFRWTSEGGMVGLGYLTPSGPAPISSIAWDVSDDGSAVVGYSSFGETGTVHAFLWTGDGGMRRVWDVLLAHGIDPAADGWERLVVASGVSADGNTIVGQGVRGGRSEGFVVAIPEPAGLSLAAVGGILLRRRPCRCRPRAGGTG